MLTGGWLAPGVWLDVGGGGLIPGCGWIAGAGVLSFPVGGLADYSGWGGLIGGGWSGGWFLGLLDVSWCARLAGVCYSVPAGLLGCSIPGRGARVVVGVLPLDVGGGGCSRVVGCSLVPVGGGWFGAVPVWGG